MSFTLFKYSLKFQDQEIFQYIHAFTFYVKEIFHVFTSGSKTSIGILLQFFDVEKWSSCKIKPL